MIYLLQKIQAQMEIQDFPEIGNFKFVYWLILHAFLLSADFFKKSPFSKIYFMHTI